VRPAGGLSSTAHAICLPSLGTYQVGYRKKFSSMREACDAVRWDDRSIWMAYNYAPDRNCPNPRTCSGTTCAIPNVVREKIPAEMARTYPGRDLSRARDKVRMPDVAGNVAWLTEIADLWPSIENPPHVTMLTHHYYFGGSATNPDVNIPKLLNPATMARVQKTAVLLNEKGETPEQIATHPHPSTRPLLFHRSLSLEGNYP